MASENVNQTDWFKSAETPIRDIAHMLMELDDKGLIPDGMRDAIYKHANNSLDTVPQNISAISHAMAAAITSDCGLDGHDAANVAYGISSLSDKAAGMNELAYHFGPLNTHRKLMTAQ